MHIPAYIHTHMGWLQVVGSLNLYVSFAEYHLFYRALLQKRSILLRSVRIEATPYIHTYILVVEVRNFNSRCPLAPPFFCRYKKYISVPHEQFIKGSLRKAPQRIFFLILNHLSTHPA